LKELGAVCTKSLTKGNQYRAPVLLVYAQFGCALKILKNKLWTQKMSGWIKIASKESAK
jgi:hypothetical protein